MISLVVGFTSTNTVAGYGDISWPQMALLVLLALGSVALGGMTEGRPWAAAWLPIALGMPLLFIGWLPQRYWHIAMAAVALHTVRGAGLEGQWRTGRRGEPHG